MASCQQGSLYESGERIVMRGQGESMWRYRGNTKAGVASCGHQLGGIGPRAMSQMDGVGITLRERCLLVRCFVRRPWVFS